MVFIVGLIMPDFNPEIIRKIVNAGGAAELHRMMLGMSKYCVPDIVRLEISREDSLLATLAIHYLDFVVRHGTGVKEAKSPKGFIEDSHEAEFEQWLGRGAPGFVWEDLVAYLRDNPLR